MILLKILREQNLNHQDWDGILYDLSTNFLGWATSRKGWNTIRLSVRPSASRNSRGPLRDESIGVVIPCQILCATFLYVPPSCVCRSDEPVKHSL